jgi:hypothetical protein
MINKTQVFISQYSNWLSHNEEFEYLSKAFGDIDDEEYIKLLAKLNSFVSKTRNNILQLMEYTEDLNIIILQCYSYINRKKKIFKLPEPSKATNNSEFRVVDTKELLKVAFRIRERLKDRRKGYKQSDLISSCLLLTDEAQTLSDLTISRYAECK